MPAISLISLLTVSNNSINNHLCTAGQIITITPVYNSSASSISGTLNGNALSFSHISGGTYKAFYTVTETDIQGALVLSITADTVTSTTTTDGKSVVIDTEEPLVNLTYVTSGVSLTQPIVGDIQTLTVSVNETLLSVPRINYGALRAARLNNIATTAAPTFTWTQLDGFTWQATYTVTGKEVLPLSIILNLTDLAGNIAIVNYNIIQPKIFDYNHTYYFYDEFINDNLSRYYASGSGAHAIISPTNVNQSGIGQFTVTAGSDYAGYNISKNYLTFIYQAYNWFQINFYISNIGTTVTGDTANVRIGFVDSDSSTPTYGMYFESDITNSRWKTVTANASSLTTHSIASAANVLSGANLLTITYDGVNVYYAINGTQIDQIAYVVTTPIGTGSFPSPGFYIYKSSGTTHTNFLDVDYFEITLKRYATGDFNGDFNNDFFN